MQFQGKKRDIYLSLFVNVYQHFVYLIEVTEGKQSGQFMRLDLVARLNLIIQY